MRAFSLPSCLNLLHMQLPSPTRISRTGQQQCPPDSNIINSACYLVLCAQVTMISCMQRAKASLELDFAGPSRTAGCPELGPHTLLNPKAQAHPRHPMGPHGPPCEAARLMSCRHTCRTQRVQVIVSYILLGPIYPLRSTMLALGRCGLRASRLRAIWAWQAFWSFWVIFPFALQGSSLKASPVTAVHETGLTGEVQNLNEALKSHEPAED